MIGVDRNQFNRTLIKSVKQSEKRFPPKRKIIHVDMDCFYAAIEIRDRPELANQPVAVGGSNRGVLTTCNYIAREYGCRSAMPAFKALQLCPKLVLVPVRFDAYRYESARIREIFGQFTDKVEPLSLDEAYLDVSHLQSEASSIAAEIRHRIYAETQLTASAGIAGNKFIAKIASDWNKPNGQFEVDEDQLDDFLETLPIEKIWGVGKRTAEKIHRLGISTCGELRQWSELDLHRHFGKFGSELFHYSRGQDDREVNPNRERKSVSNERTFRENIEAADEGLERLAPLVGELIDDLSNHDDRQIREGFVKLKFEDFSSTTAQIAMSEVNYESFKALLLEAWARGNGKTVRLIGAGVRFQPLQEGDEPMQMEMF